MTINVDTEIKPLSTGLFRDSRSLINAGALIPKFPGLPRGELIGGRSVIAPKISGYNVEELYEKPGSAVLTADFKTGNVRTGVQPSTLVVTSEGWDQLLPRFKNRVQTIDLRSLDSQMSMLMISGELRYLPPETALFFILRKRIPVSYLAELENKHFDYRVKTISEAEVNLLIFRPGS